MEWYGGIISIYSDGIQMVSHIIIYRLLDIYYNVHSMYLHTDHIDIIYRIGAPDLTLPHSPKSNNRSADWPAELPPAGGSGRFGCHPSVTCDACFAKPPWLDGTGSPEACLRFFFTA